MTQHYDALEMRDPAQREAALLAALPVQVAHAQSRSPAMAQALQGIDGHAVRTRAELAQLPVTRKQALFERQKAQRAAGGDAFFVTMYNYYHPLHLTLVAAYDIWVAQNGTQESQTLTLAQLLRLLSNTKAEDWMVAVKAHYGKNTARFKELFPDLKKVFQNGTQLERISAVNAFSIAIGADSLLATLKTEVDLFYTSLKTANTTQKGSITNTSLMSKTIEEARVASAIGQFADYGGLIQKYAATPEVVGPYFDEAAIRKGAQVLFHHHVVP